MNDKKTYTAKIFFFFNDTATTEIYTLSLHDALPIYRYLRRPAEVFRDPDAKSPLVLDVPAHDPHAVRSEEHTSELQSRLHLVCRLLLEKKKHNNTYNHSTKPKQLPRTHTQSTDGRSC